MQFVDPAEERRWARISHVDSPEFNYEADNYQY